MTAVNFPSSPSNGDTLTSGNTTYTYNSTKTRWDAVTTVNGIQLNSLSVGAEAAATGDGGIAYDNTSGEFTYTPPLIGDSLPAQTDNTGKFLTTDGTDASWATVASGAGYEIGTGLELTDPVTTITWPASPVLTAQNDGTVAKPYLGHSIAATADYVVSGHGDGNAIEVYNARTGAFIRTIVVPQTYLGSLDLDGTNLIVGARGARKAYIYNVTTGALLHTLSSSLEQFGYQVCISGNYAVVSGANVALSVFNVTTGALLYTINNPNRDGGDTSDSFGQYGLAITPSYIIASAIQADTGGNANAGIVYIFDVSNGSLLCTRFPPTPVAGKRYGSALDEHRSISAFGDLVAFRPNDSYPYDGAVHVHSITALIAAPTSSPLYTLTVAGSGPSFGDTVSMSGNYLAVGAQSSSAGGFTGAGAAYLYDLTDGSLLYSVLGTSYYAKEGYAVAVAPGVFVTGAHDNFGTGNPGKIRIYNGDVSSTSYLQPDNTIATTSYVDTSVSNLVDSSPAALNTLNELAAALGDDANFSTTVTNSIATKAPLADPTFTGVPAAPTAAAGTNTTQLATTAFVTTATAAAAGDTLPAQTDNTGKFLTTDGTVASWGTAPISDKLTLSSTTTSVYSTASVTPSSVVSHAQVYGWGLDSTYTIIGESIDKLHVYNSSNMSFIKTITLAGIQYQGKIRSISVANGKCLVAMPGENSNTGRVMLVDISSESILWTKYGSTANTLALLGRGEVSLTSTHAAICHHEGVDGLGYGSVRIYDIAGTELWNIAGTSSENLDATSLTLNSTHFAYSIKPAAQIVVRSLATGEITATIAAPSGADSSYLYVPGGGSSNATGMSETHIAATAYTQVRTVGGVAHKGVVHVWDLAGNITNTFVSPTAQANMGGTFFGQDGVKVEGDIVVTSQWRQDEGVSMPTATTGDALQFYSISADSHTHKATFSNSASTTTNKSWGRLVRYNEGIAGATMGDTSPYEVQTFRLGSSDLTTYEYLNAPTIATTAYVDTSVSNLVDSSPAALNTLNELAAALGDDANFSTTVTNSIATKAPLVDPTFTGVPAAPTAAAGTNTTQLATTAFVTTALGAVSSGASVAVSATAPSSAEVGDMWIDSATLILYVYYNDGSSSQWVEVASSSSSGGGITFSEATSGVTMAAGSTYILNTSTALTLTLPAAAAIGDKIGIIDGTGQASTNNITIARNGHKIQGLSEDMTVAKSRAAFELVYYNTSNGWLLTSV